MSKLTIKIEKAKAKVEEAQRLLDDAESVLEDLKNIQHRRNYKKNKKVHRKKYANDPMYRLIHRMNYMMFYTSLEEAENRFQGLKTILDTHELKKV